MKNQILTFAVIALIAGLLPSNQAAAAERNNLNALLDSAHHERERAVDAYRMNEAAHEVRAERTRSRNMIKIEIGDELGSAGRKNSHAKPSRNVSNDSSHF